MQQTLPARPDNYRGRRRHPGPATHHTWHIEERLHGHTTPVWTSSYHTRRAALADYRALIQLVTQHDLAGYTPHGNRRLIVIEVTPMTGGDLAETIRAGHSTQDGAL